MSRVFNFSAGPAVIPDAVLEQIRQDIPDWNDIGMSVMEISHRSKEFVSVAEKAEQDLRDLLAIPDNYSVLFPQGGASLQFAMAPLNLSSAGQVVDYVQTGSWSRKAIGEAGKFCDVNVLPIVPTRTFTYVPPESSWSGGRMPRTCIIAPTKQLRVLSFRLFRIPEIRRWSATCPVRFCHARLTSVDLASSTRVLRKISVRPE